VNVRRVEHASRGPPDGTITTDDLINALDPGWIERWIVLQVDVSRILVNYFASKKDFEY
jgi:hypothetical protein